MIVTTQYLRFFTALFFSIVSCILFSASIDSRTKTTLLKPGVWQSKLDTQSLLYVTNEHFAFYHIGQKTCALLGKRYPIKNAHTIIQDVRFKKEFSQGWLLSPTPSITTLTFSQFKNHTTKTDSYRQINELPRICRTIFRAVL